MMEKCLVCKKEFDKNTVEVIEHSIHIMELLRLALKEKIFTPDEFLGITKPTSPKIQKQKAQQSIDNVMGKEE